MRIIWMVEIVKRIMLFCFIIDNKVIHEIARAELSCQITQLTMNMHFGFTILIVFKKKQLILYT